MPPAKQLSASLEDYLEAIYHLVAEKKTARVKDISMRLRVNKSSVTGALKLLTQKKLIYYAPYEQITLTKRGQEIARGVVRKHEALREFFIKVLSIDKRAADEAACKIEHEISPEILTRFIQFVDFVETCPRMGSDWISGFGYHCKHEPDTKRCKNCVEKCLSDLKLD